MKHKQKTKNTTKLNEKEEAGRRGGSEKPNRTYNCARDEDIISSLTEVGSLIRADKARLEFGHSQKQDCVHE